MREPRYPALYQINTRVWLTERSRALGRPATLDDMPDAEVDPGGRDGVRPEAVRGLITGRFPIAGTPSP